MTRTANARVAFHLVSYIFRSGWTNGGRRSHYNQWHSCLDRRQTKKTCCSENHGGDGEKKEILSQQKHSAWELGIVSKSVLSEGLKSASCQIIW